MKMHHISWCVLDDEGPDLLVPSRILGSTTDDISDFLFDLELPPSTVVVGDGGIWPRPLTSMGSLVAVLSGAVRGSESRRTVQSVQSELTGAERRALSGLELGPSAPLLRAGAALRLELAHALATQPGQGPDRALSEAKVDRSALTRLLDVASGVVEQLASAQDSGVSAAAFAAVRSALVRDMAPLSKLRGRPQRFMRSPLTPAVVEPLKARKKPRARRAFVAVFAVSLIGSAAFHISRARASTPTLRWTQAPVRVLISKPGQEARLQRTARALGLQLLSVKGRALLLPNESRR